jgi:hypothetical protein
MLAAFSNTHPYSSIALPILGNVDGVRRGEEIVTPAAKKQIETRFG